MATDAVRGELPEEVITFGGGGGTHYHRIGYDGGPACGQHGGNPLRKDRVAIETHYDPCPRCFPRVVRGDGR